MHQLNSKVVEALGYRWTLSSVDIAAEQGRAQLESEVRAYLGSLSRPASRYGANALLSGYYPDILSATEKLELWEIPLPDEETTEGHWSDVTDTVLDWFFDVDGWIKFVRGQMEKSKAKELSDLWKVAKDLNPGWYPEITLKDADEETKKASQELDKMAAFVDSPDDSPHPDTAKAAENAAKVADHVETKAKEAGKVGPVTFRGKSKGAA